MDIELEVQKEDSIKGPYATCDICQSAPATRKVTIGEIRNNFGIDYFLCEAPPCEDKAFEIELAEILTVKKDQKKLMGEEKFNGREGK